VLQRDSQVPQEKGGVLQQGNLKYEEKGVESS
jgi:hypothetical protein